MIVTSAGYLTAGGTTVGALRPDFAGSSVRATQYGGERDVMSKNIKSRLLGLAAAVVGSALLCSSGAKADTFNLDFTADAGTELAAGNFSAHLTLTTSDSEVGSTLEVTGVSGTLTVSPLNAGQTGLNSVIPAGTYNVTLDNLLVSPFSEVGNVGGTLVADQLGFSITETNGTTVAFFLGSNGNGGSSLFNNADTATHELVNIGNGNGDSISLTPTPLPSTWVVMLGGLLALGFVAVRGMKANSGAGAALAAA
jgi:hypothetical protein